MRAGTEVALLSAVASVFCLGACTGFESEYKKGVYDYEPLYCYQTIGAVDCRREPHHRDAARLVNYYAPAPGKYDLPDPPEESPLRPPPKVTAAYRDPEPAVGPAPATAATRQAEGRNSASADDAEGAAGQPAAAEEKSEWKEWLPLISVAFGALQVVAAFRLLTIASRSHPARQAHETARWGTAPRAGRGRRSEPALDLFVEGGTSRVRSARFRGFRGPASCFRHFFTGCWVCGEKTVPSMSGAKKRSRTCERDPGHLEKSNLIECRCSASGRRKFGPDRDIFVLFRV